MKLLNYIFEMMGYLIGLAAVGAVLTFIFNITELYLLFQGEPILYKQGMGFVVLFNVFLSVIAHHLVKKPDINIKLNETEELCDTE